MFTGGWTELDTKAEEAREEAPPLSRDKRNVAIVRCPASLERKVSGRRIGII